MDLCKLRKLRKYFMAVLHVTRLKKSMRRFCLNPVAARVEQKTDEISTGSRRKADDENLRPCHQYDQSRHLKLKFSNNIKGPIFTGLPVGGEGSTLNVDLVDPYTENIVKFGAEASTKVEIVALEKDFTTWPTEKSLIHGDPHVTLKNGTVSINHISFKHTNKSMKKRELRLGARAVCPCCNIGTRIIEAVTESFFLKDRRSMGKSLKPLMLDDQVWKLQGIAKKGPFHIRLLEENIKTVKDFLTQYFLNREKLFSILGRRMNSKKLEAAVSLAKSKLDLKRYIYPSDNSQQNVRVIFTIVGEVIGVYQQGQFLPAEKFSGTQTDSAMDLVKTAFQDGHQYFKVLDDDIFTSSNEVTAFDGFNGFSFEDNYMGSTSVINNYDSITQIMNSPATLISTNDELPDLIIDPHHDNDDFFYQSLWDI